MELNKLQKFLIFYVVILIAYWVFLFGSGLKTSFWNYFYSFSFSLIALVGGFIGMFLAKPWGLLKSAIGKAVFFISAGLFTWGVGSMIWAYYNFFEHIAAPYPSLADLWYVFTIPLWIAGTIDLSKATGAKFGFKAMKGKLLLIFIPLVVIIFSYYLLVVVARSGMITDLSTGYLKIFFDLAYPIGDIIILTLALIIFGLSFNYFGGKYKLPIFAILLGFTLMYVADFVFSYTTTIGTFFVGYWGDLLFMLALGTITFGILGFYRPKK